MTYQHQHLRAWRFIIALAVCLVATPVAYAQQAAFGRLARDVFDVTPPSARVHGSPGEMEVRQMSCRILPDDHVRRRMVDIAVQEWAFFGFTVVDQTIDRRTVDRPSVAPTARSASAPGARRGGFRFRWLDPDESARVAGSIGGYWAVTPEGGWILDNQNKEWNGPNGVAARWRDPWSAAFISWVMCESGLGETRRFQRAVAHHVYIDQAIRARDGRAAAAAFVAYDLGEQAIQPGDMLCSGRRPAYRSLAERRRQMGDGARTHCDIVVRVDGPAGRILAIGGNVRGTVSLKVVPAGRAGGGELRPAAADDDRAGWFAHLKLRTDPIEGDAFDAAPTMKALACAVEVEMPALTLAAKVMPATLGAGPSECSRSARAQ